MNVRPKAIKLLEENIGGELLGISLGDDLTPKAKAAKAKKNNEAWVVSEKLFCTLKMLGST